MRAIDDPALDLRFARNKEEAIPLNVFTRRDVGVSELLIFAKAQLVDSNILRGDVDRVVTRRDARGYCRVRVDHRHDVNFSTGRSEVYTGDPLPFID